MAQTISVLGIDIAKLVFHAVGMDDSGHLDAFALWERCCGVALVRCRR
jgi:hypothetical protein